MKRSLSSLVCLFLFGACTQKTVAPDEAAVVSTRFAKAELAVSTDPATPKSPEGMFRFEQMPNSTIVTYRLQELVAKTTYQVFLRIAGDCATPLDPQKDVIVYQFKAGKTGASESTFKMENVSVSKANPVIGKKMVLSALKKAKNPKSGVLVGCTEIVASDANDHLLQLGGMAPESEKTNR